MESLSEEQMTTRSHDAYAYVRGVNYHPSYCTTLYETWDRFDMKVWGTEIRQPITIGFHPYPGWWV